MRGEVMPRLTVRMMKETGRSIAQAAAIAGVSFDEMLHDSLRFSDDNAAAEPILRNVVETFDRIGMNPGAIVGGLVRLSGIARSQGDHPKAWQLARRATDVAARRIGKRSPYYMTALAAQADAIEELPGEEKRVVSLLRRALRLARALHPPRHPNVLALEGRLADVLVGRGRYREAQAAIEAVVRGLAANRIDLARADLINALVVLSDCHEHFGRTRAALAALERARSLAVRRRDRRVGPIESEIGKALIRAGRFAEAVPHLARALDRAEQRLRREGRAMSSKSMDTLLGVGLGDDQFVVSALAMARPDLAPAVRLALAYALLRKGRALDEAALRQRAMHEARSDRRFGHLRALRARIAHATLGAGDEANPSEDGVAALTAEADALEIELAREAVVERVRRDPPTRAAIVSRVAGALPARAALVEYVRATPYDFTWRGPAGSPWGDDHYLAFVVRPRRAPVVVDLGPAAVIDAAARTLWNAVGGESPDKDWQTPSRALHDLVIAPLLPHLRAPIDRLFLSPDSQLHRVPFAALHDGQGCLVDRFRLTMVTSGRDLLRFRDRAPVHHTVHVIADPDYGNHAAPDEDGGRAIDLAGLVDLPGTGREAAAILDRFPNARVRKGPDATEDALLALRAPGILHVAAHGDYWGRDIDTDDPLVRTALALTGAQRFHERTSDQQPDGVVTALELSGMDLAGTQLVVLSACSTGRGDIDDYGGGVANLARAALVAGAESVVCSLWKVSDRMAARFMRDYYGALADGAPRDEALWTAAKALRARRKVGDLDCSHPRFWAAFVPIGRPGPLRDLAALRPRRG